MYPADKSAWRETVYGPTCHVVNKSRASPTGTDCEVIHSPLMVSQWNHQPVEPAYFDRFSMIG